MLSKQNRYTYAPIFPFGAQKVPAIGKYDAQTGTRKVHDFKPYQLPSEAYSAPDLGGTSEDDGWLFTYVGDLSTQLSELWILDAKSILAEPVAVIELPAWVPAGIHGSWIPDSVLLQG